MQPPRVTSSRVVYENRWMRVTEDNRRSLHYREMAPRLAEHVQQPRKRLNRVLLLLTRAALLAREIVDERLDRVLEDVVAEHHQELVAVDEVPTVNVIDQAVEVTTSTVAAQFHTAGPSRRRCPARPARG